MNQKNINEITVVVPDHLVTEYSEILKKYRNCNVKVSGLQAEFGNILNAFKCGNIEIGAIIEDVFNDVAQLDEINTNKTTPK